MNCTVQTSTNPYVCTPTDILRPSAYSDFYLSILKLVHHVTIYTIYLLPLSATQLNRHCSHLPSQLPLSLMSYLQISSYTFIHAHALLPSPFILVQFSFTPIFYNSHFYSVTPICPLLTLFPPANPSTTQPTFSPPSLPVASECRRPPSVVRPATVLSHPVR